MVILIAVVAILLVILVALVLAVAVKGLDSAVIQSSSQLKAENKAYNPAMTLGHEIQAQGSAETQYREARQLAAKQAAATPRGANVQIGPQYKQERQRTAFDGLNEDPITAVKIAAFHGWDGVRTGIVAVDPAAAAAAAPAATSGGKTELVPGKDYLVIEITDAMSDDEVRKARIANAKAKSAAMKAAKTAPESGAAAPVAPTVSATTAAPVLAAVAGLPEPAYIEITDNMSPEEKRKARIENSKMKSTYNKALKAAGVDPAAASTEPQVAPQPAPAPAAAVPAAAANIPAPQLIEITSDMSPDEVRQARVANAKANSAYNKALKAAGIDPGSVA
ncbi:MAG: hypothetical protein R6X34_00405 [Chloroflexota bacterium]